MDIKQLITRGTFPRNYRKKTTPSSINPAIAYAMNLLVGLDENDRILDPCCGTATILIERQLLKPTICIGVDIDPRQLSFGKENIEEMLRNNPNLPPLLFEPERPQSRRPNPLPQGAREYFENTGIMLFHGDITEKKFPEGYFTKIISNLPYGLHSGSREKNVKLYHFLADISSTWLKKGGKAILLTSSKKLLKNSFDFNPKMKLVEKIEIPNDSLKRAIFVFERIF